MNCDCLCGGARTATFWANLDGVALMSFKTLTEEWKQGIRTDLAEEMVHKHTKLYEALAGSSLRNSFLEDIQWRRGEQMTDLSATAKTNHAQALERTDSIYTWLQAEVAQAWLVETDGFMEATRENNFDGDPISMNMPNPRVMEVKDCDIG